MARHTDGNRRGGGKQFRRAHACARDPTAPGRHPRPHHHGLNTVSPNPSGPTSGLYPSWPRHRLALDLCVTMLPQFSCTVSPVPQDSTRIAASLSPLGPCSSRAPRPDTEAEEPSHLLTRMPQVQESKGGLPPCPQRFTGCVRLPWGLSSWLSSRAACLSPLWPRGLSPAGAYRVP